MNKGDPVRKTRTHRPPVNRKPIIDRLIRVALGEGRKKKRRNIKRNRRVNYQGYRYRGSNSQKGAYGKCKFLKYNSAER